MDSHALAVVAPQSLVPTPDIAALTAAFFAGKSPRTIAAYKQDLGDFQSFVGAATMDDAARLLLGNGQGAANMTALQYRNHLHARGMAAATINRRLAALRSLVAVAQTVGMVPYGLSVPGMKAAAYRDTAGPGDDGFHRMLDLLVARADAKAVRDLAILRLLHDLALRRGEVVSLDLAHIRGVSLDVLGKGRSEREALVMPKITRDALAAWVAIRGDRPGAIFTNLDRAGKGDRLTGTSIYRIVQRIGRDVGLDVWPHGLRHLSITTALEVKNGDVRAVRSFSRHADVKTLLLYDDNRTNPQGEIAALVAGYARPQTVRGRWARPPR